MTPEVEAYLLKSREDLEEAETIATLGLAKAAARSAYYAAFHAAEALILLRTGKIAKTHSGVRTELARILKYEADYGRTLTRFLADAYRFKALGDYSVDSAAKISMDDAKVLIQGAIEFVRTIEALTS